MKILLTSVGRRVELVQALKSAAKDLKIELEVWGVDIVNDAPALMFCDNTKKICRIDDPEYINQLIEICKEERIDCLIPTIDTDLLILAENKDKFEKLGVWLLISELEKIRICRDKNLTYKFFKGVGLNSPTTCNSIKDYKAGYPAFIKPKDGSSARDAYKVNCYSELVEFSSIVNNYIIQPFIDGIEYTVDIFCDKDGSPIYITPRERVLIRAGEVIKTKIDLDEKIIREVKELLFTFKPNGPITVQLIRERKTGIDYFIEINPRFGGGAPLSMKAGANSAKAVLRILNGEKLEYIPNAAENNAVYSRFDQSVRVL